MEATTDRPSLSRRTQHAAREGLRSGVPRQSLAICLTGIHPASDCDSSGVIL